MSSGSADRHYYLFFLLFLEIKLLQSLWINVTLTRELTPSLEKLEIVLIRFWDVFFTNKGLWATDKKIHSGCFLFMFILLIFFFWWCLPGEDSLIRNRFILFVYSFHSEDFNFNSFADVCSICFFPQFSLDKISNHSAILDLDLLPGVNQSHLIKRFQEDQGQRKLLEELREEVRRAFQVE